MITKRIKEVIDDIFAENEDLSLRNRLFLSAIIYGVLITIIGSVVTLFVSSSFIALYITSLIICFLLVVYYFARFKKIFKPFIVPVIAGSMIGIFTIWVLGGGMNGPNIVLAFVVLILSLIVVSDNYKKFIIVFFILLVIICYLIQFYRPDLIINYSSETKRWVDGIITVSYSSFFIYLIIRFLLKQYTIERQRAEEGEKKFRFIVDNVGEGIAFVDPKEEFIFANPSAESLFGTGCGELTGRNLKEFLSEDQYILILAQTGLRREGKSSIYEFEIIRPDGTKRVILNTAVPQFDINNEFIGTHGIFRDITERKREENVLREKEEKYRMLIENNLDIIYKLNPEGVFTFVSPAWTVLLGHPVYSVIGKLFKQFIHPDDFEEWVRFRQKVIATGQRHQGIRFRVQHENGTWIWLTSSAAPIIDENEKLLGCYGIARDITELRQNEERLHQLNAGKDRFISVLSNDLKSPVNTLLELSESLKENIHKSDIVEIEDLVNKINKEAHNTSDLLEELLKWSKNNEL